MLRVVVLTLPAIVRRKKEVQHSTIRLTREGMQVPPVRVEDRERISCLRHADMYISTFHAQTQLSQWIFNKLQED